MQCGKVNLMPKLSVIVPVYNTEKYLRICVDSILGQSFPDFELLLVDDGSTDRCGTICDEYARLDKRVQVIHQANGGVTAARNKGLEVACGEYVSFVDSDDWLERDMYQAMMEKATEKDADVVLCDMYAEVHNGSSIIPSSLSRFSGYYDAGQIKEQLQPKMLFDLEGNAPGLSLNLCNKLIRSELVRRASADLPSDVTYGEDLLCCLICLLCAKGIYILKDCAYYHYRRTDEFLARESDVSLLAQLMRFTALAETLLKKWNFDATIQLACYVAQISLYSVRQILLYNKNLDMREKTRYICNYLNEDRVCNAFQLAQTHIADKKTRKKIELVNKKRCRFLLALFVGKETLLRVLGKG